MADVNILSKIPEHWTNHVWKATSTLRLIANNHEMVEIKSARTKLRPVIVHKTLLCFYSIYHNQAMQAPFKKLELLDHMSRRLDPSPEVVRLFQGWLYTGQIISDTRIQPPEFNLLVDLYIYAYSLMSVALQRTVMSYIQIACRDSCRDGLVMPYETIRKLWDTPLEHSDLYRYIQDSYAYHWTPHLTTEDWGMEGYRVRKNIQPKFLYSMLEYRWQVDKENICDCCYNLCRYHVHESEGERRATCEYFFDFFRDESSKLANEGSEGAIVTGTRETREGESGAIGVR